MERTSARVISSVVAVLCAVCVLSPTAVSSSQSSEPFKVYFDITKAHAALVDLFR